MLAAPDTWPIDLAPLQSEIALPYTLTPGKAAGVFLAEMKNQRIIGSRFKNSGIVVAPAQDFCPQTGDSEFDLVEAPQTGSVTAFTQVGELVIALIRLDGCDEDFPHRIVDAGLADLAIGMRVAAVWDRDVENSILAIRGFAPAPDAAVGSIRPLESHEPQVQVIPYSMALQYEHAYGPYYGRLFDTLQTEQKILGTRTPDGERAFLPPRAMCDVTHKPSGTWMMVKDTGTVRACSIINMEFIGQTRSPPYIYAEIILDGAATRLVHMIACDDIQAAKETVKPGTRVRAVWADDKVRSLKAISHFEVIGS
jgi:uncharacterized protein